MFDWFKKKTRKRRQHDIADAAPQVKAGEQESTKTAKELATERGEPWVAVLEMEVDYNNLAQGAFTLDWNDKFVSNLLRAGYQGRSDADIVDQWFQNVCRHVVMETYEQEQAIKNSGVYVQSRDIGNGRSEVS